MSAVAKFRLQGFGILLIILLVSACVCAQDEGIADAIVKLSSRDPEIRYHAAVFLCSTKHDPRAVQPLLNALNDPSDNIRETIVNTFGYWKEPLAVRSLIPLLKDKNKTVQARAADALGNIGDTAAVPPLIEALGTFEKDYKWSAIRALGEFNDPRAVEPLFALVTEGYDSVLAKAIGSAGVPVMIDIVSTGSPERRASAVWILSQIADDRATETLVSVLGDEDANVSYNAINGIAHRIGPSAITQLQNAFEKGSPQTRGRIVHTLAKIAHEKSGEVLIELATTGDVPTRLGVIRQLSESYPNIWHPDKSQIINALLAAFDDEDASVRDLAMRTLAHEQRADVYQRFVTELSGPNASVEASLAIGLRKDLRALPYLFKSLVSEDTDLANRSHQVLAAIGEPAVTGFIEVLASRDSRFPRREQKRRDAESKAPFMFRCGNEPPPPILDPRVLAANALGYIGDERARVPLRRASDGKSVWLREAAVLALQKLDAKQKASQTP